MNIVIIKYNAGNICSVDFALQRLGISAVVTDDKNLILNADKVIFPGVGEASSAMSYLKEKKIDTIIKSLTQPTLGICLGMQLLCNYSQENDTECLGIIPVNIRKFKLNNQKVPQMGWNKITNLKSPLFNNIDENQFMYFVHSYYAENSDYSIANCYYGIDFCAAIQFKNFYATQFHPEKSGDIGQHVLFNFLNL